MWEWPKGVDQRGWQLDGPPQAIRDWWWWPSQVPHKVGEWLWWGTGGHALDSKKIEQRTSRSYTCVRNSFLKVHNFTFKILSFKGAICKWLTLIFNIFHLGKLHVVKNINMGHSWTTSFAHINHDSIDMPCCIEKTISLDKYSWI
jgi:hypothetical protein